MTTPAPRATDRLHVESTSGSPSILPLARVPLSQTEMNAPIEQAFAQLFGGLHVALSVFAAVPARRYGRLVDRLVSLAAEPTPLNAQLVTYFFYYPAAQGLCTRAAFEAGFAVTAARLEEVTTESPGAVLLFATMARGASLHKDADCRRRVFGRLERMGYGCDLTSFSSV